MSILHSRFLITRKVWLAKEHLSPETKKKLERPQNHLIAQMGSPAFDHEKKVLEDLTKLEKNGRLVRK